MVGNSNEFDQILSAMLIRLKPHESCFFLFRGEVGSGRKIVAKAMYEDLANEFDCCAWVTIGTEEYGLKDVLGQILSQVDHYNSQNDEMGEDVCNLCQVLKHRRYLIVVDDIRDVKLVKYLRSSLPNQSNGSRVFVTSSLEELKSVSDHSFNFHFAAHCFEQLMLMHLLWLVFGDEAVPPGCVEAGKKIVDNCGGSRLLAAKTMLFLHTTPVAVEEWKKIAAVNQNPIFILEGDEISERSTISALLQSYCSCNPKSGCCATCEFILPIINFDKSIRALMKMMKPERFFCKMQIISLLGMAGIGKSTLSQKNLQTSINHQLLRSSCMDYFRSKISIGRYFDKYSSSNKSKH